MPRIYSDNPAHCISWSPVPFAEGVAAVPPGTDISYYTAERGYTVDTSKDRLEVWDRLTVAELDELNAYLGGMVSPEDTKAQKVRAVEAAISAFRLGSLTVASAAGSTSGATKLTVTDPADGDYYLKTGAAASPAILYGDTPDGSWTKLELTDGVADNVAPTSAGDTKGTICLVVGGRVTAAEQLTVTLKA